MRQPMTLAVANATLHGEDLFRYLWRRAECADRLSRDEFPWLDWDKEFPDLAVERLRKVEAERCSPK